MRILLDHCLPRRLKNHLTGHQVATAAEMGWDRLRNGALLAAAGAQFDVFLTIDKSIEHQQNVAMLPIAVVVILAPSNRLPDLLLYVPHVEAAIARLTPKSLIEVALP